MSGSIGRGSDHCAEDAHRDVRQMFTRTLIEHVSEQIGIRAVPIGLFSCIVGWRMNDASGSVFVQICFPDCG